MACDAGAVYFIFNMIQLNRRQVVLLPLALGARGANASAQPWQIRFLSAGFSGDAYEGGLLVRMEPGWKTYWRIPGAGGIPPEIKAEGENLAAFSFDCPVPARFSGEDGETIGYENEVVFPFRARPRDPAKALELALSAFVGVCEQICIPVQSKDRLVFSPQGAPSPDVALLSNWKARVPRPVSDAIRSATVAEHDGKPALQLALARQADDLFVEGSPMHFYGAPLWRVPGLEAVLPVSGLKSADALKGEPLRITLAIPSESVEQQISLS